MSHEPTTDSSDGEDEKVAATIVPQNHHRLPQERESKSLADEIKSTKTEFDREFNPAENRENMRGAVTSRIIWMYVICVSLIILSGTVRLLFSASPEATKAIIESLRSLVDFLNVLVLPIITLVLGFYFGSEKK